VNHRPRTRVRNHAPRVWCLVKAGVRL
jgi:hypothetical protein